MNVRIRRSGNLVRILLAATLGVAVGAGALVWTRTKITRLRYVLMELHETEQQRRSAVEQLRVELAAEQAPERIEARARAMGLRYPDAGQVVALKVERP